LSDLRPKAAREVVAILERVVVWFLLGVIQGVLLIRVCAVYRSNKKTKWTLGCLFGVELFLALLGTVDAEITQFPVYNVLIVNIPVILYECLLMVLLTRAFLLHRREVRDLGEYPWQSMMNVIFQDSCLYFLILILGNLTEAASRWYTNMGLNIYVRYALLFLEATVGPRLALNLRETQSKRDSLYFLSPNLPITVPEASSS